jgi:histidine triad (HIT) family protein
METKDSCVFCRIVAGESPSRMVYQGEELVAFRDIAPKAPTHILIVPREHIPSLAEVTQEHSRLLAEMIHLANRLAKQEGIDQSGYRLVTNCGPWAGQAVPHLHFHLIGGKPLRWLH